MACSVFFKMEHVEGQGSLSEGVRGGNEDASHYKNIQQLIQLIYFL